MEEVVVWLANDEINKDDLSLIIECLFTKFVNSKDYVDEIVQGILTEFRNLEELLSDIDIKSINDIMTSLKKSMALIEYIFIKMK